MSTSSPPPAYTVAVVDDDPAATLMLERILGRSGFGVVIYSSGEDFLAALPSSRPDVVCLDLSLPGIDGLETLRRTKAVEPTLPILLFSAGGERMRAEALGAGARACLDKNAPWEEVLAAIENALRAT